MSQGVTGTAKQSLITWKEILMKKIMISLCITLPGLGIMNVAQGNNFCSGTTPAEYLYGSPTSICLNACPYQGKNASGGTLVSTNLYQCDTCPPGFVLNSLGWCDTSTAGINTQVCGGSNPSCATVACQACHNKCKLSSGWQQITCFGQCSCIP